MFKISGRKAQNKCNHKRACETYKKLLELNFSDESTKILCFTHSRKINRAGATTEFRNYIRRLNYWLHKAGHENVKYLFVTEYEGKPKHYAFMICPFSAVYLIREWQHGEAFIVDAANMCGKLREDTKHKKRWISSKGLLKE